MSWIIKANTGTDIKGDLICIRGGIPYGSRIEDNAGVNISSQFVNFSHQLKAPAGYQSARGGSSKWTRLVDIALLPVSVLLIVPAIGLVYLRRWLCS